MMRPHAVLIESDTRSRLDTRWDSRHLCRSSQQSLPREVSMLPKFLTRTSLVRRLGSGAFALGLALLAVPALFAGPVRAAGRTDATPTFPGDLSPAGIRALASHTTDPEMQKQLQSMLPEGGLEA